MMWREHEHPRDEYGRFRLKGHKGLLDRMAAQMEAFAAAQQLAAWAQNQAVQDRYWRKREAGTLTAEEDRHWDELGDQAEKLWENLPKAAKRSMRPSQDGLWYHVDGNGNLLTNGPAFDAEGRRLPPAAVMGWTRVGDSPSGSQHLYGRQDPGPLGGGAWHKPGEYGPGRVPVLRNDFGHFIGALEPKPSRSRQHRRAEGPASRAEDRLSRRDIINYHGRERIMSADVRGGFLISPLNPVGRRRSARVKKQRAESTTWIERLNAQMGGSRG